MAQLPDGEVMTVGGYGGLTTGQHRDRRHRDLRSVDRTPGRGSPTCTIRAGIRTVTELADGRYVAISGNSTNANTWADTPEVYDPVDQHLDAALESLHIPGPRGRVPLLLPGAERERLHDRPVRGRLLRAERRATRPGPRSVERAASSTARRSCTCRARSSTAAARRASSSTTSRLGEHVGHRPDGRDAEMAADRADAQRAHLPHLDDARRRDSARGRRRDDQRPEARHDRRAADGNLESGDRNVDDRRRRSRPRATTTRPRC